MLLTYTFTEAEFRAAHDEWGANCGPAALAFALQTTLDVVRTAIPDFETRRYTSPTMMAAALARLDRLFTAVRNPSGGRDERRSFYSMFDHPCVALTRIQWAGPWTANGATAKWAARQTHWIVTWASGAMAAMVFDCNGGIRTFETWKTEIVPAIVATIPRADGGWFPANVWQLR